MPLVALTSVAPDPYGWQLNAVSDMLTALDYLLDRGYEGEIIGSKATGTKVFRVAFRRNSGTVHQVAGLGDWIVIDKQTAVGTQVTAHVVTAAEATAGTRYVPR